MNAKHIEQLQSDLIKYCDQIGIQPEERPRLITSRKEYHELMVASGRSKRAAAYGQCNYELKTIFVDCSKRSYQRKEYRRSVPADLRNQPKPYLTKDANKKYFYIRRRNSTLVRVYREAKAAYRDKLHVLVHELTHYRFRYMNHSKEFEERIREILHGRTFPVKQLST